MIYITNRQFIYLWLWLLSCTGNETLGGHLHSMNLFSCSLAHVGSTAIIMIWPRGEPPCCNIKRSSRDAASRGRWSWLTWQSPSNCAVILCTRSSSSVEPWKEVILWLFRDSGEQQQHRHEEWMKKTNPEAFSNSLRGIKIKKKKKHWTGRRKSEEKDEVVLT